MVVRQRGKQYQKAADVTFQFSLSTNTSGGGQTQNWGNGKHRHALQNNYDYGYTYQHMKKLKGLQEQRSVFDPAKNPGWTLNADGTVSKTITGGDTLTDTNSEAELALRNERLVLSFPDAKTKLILLITPKQN